MRLRIIDAFTDQPFAGNPAAVVLLDGYTWPPEQWMRQVAAEMNLSETAFAHRMSKTRSAEWALRWFTPVVEDDLCGHATLATAHAIHSDTGDAGALRFHTRSGILTAHATASGEITLDFPAALITQAPAPAGLAKALGTTPEATFSTGTLRDLLAVLPGEATVRTLDPDLAAVATLTRRHQLRAITITAGADPGSGYDFVSRFFSPADGIPEDPVTGSAHTALAPYWTARLGRNRLTGLQASARGGLVHTTTNADRVHLTGHAVTVLDGTLHHPPGSQ